MNKLRELYIKHKIRIMVGLLIFFTFIVSLMWVVTGYFSPIYFLSENQNLYILSTQAQVIGAIYGLTIAGYTFQRNNQDKQIESDPSLKDAVSLNQKEERALLYALTLISVSTILLSMFSLVTFEDIDKKTRVIAKNLSSALFFVDMLLFAYFILYVLRLNKIEKASQEIKKGIDKEEDLKSRGPSTSRGAEGGEDSSDEALDEINPAVRLMIFLNSFNKIEEWLNMMMDIYIRNLNVNQNELGNHYQNYNYGKNNRLPISKVLRDLVSLGLISSQLERELSEIIKYRNALVHGKDLTPSSVMVSKIENLALEVERLL